MTRYLVDWTPPGLLLIGEEGAQLFEGCALTHEGERVGTVVRASIAAPGCIRLELETDWSLEALQLGPYAEVR